MWRIFAIIWTLIIFIGLSLPGSSLPGGGVSIPDKIVHFVLFAGLGALWMHASSAPLSTRTRRVLLIGSLYAVALELWQGLMTALNRSPEALDALAGILGLLVAIGGYLGWWHIRH